MLKLKTTLEKAGIRPIDIARELDVSPSALSLVMNHGIIPKRRDLKGELEAYLHRRGLSTKGIWAEVAASALATTRKRAAAQPKASSELTLEVKMLSQKTMRHFKLFRDPFRDEVKGKKDIYMTDSTRYALAAMRDTAQNRGILAVVGDAGAGKTVLRKLLLDEFAKEGGFSVIMPQIIDKTGVTAAILCDAIISDLSDEVGRRSQEHKARQVERLLRLGNQAGQRQVIVIEEAHDLNVKILKYLKRFWELEDVFQRFLGIILVGQTELKHKLDESRSPQIREFSRRCSMVELEPLVKDLPGYLKHKFERCGSSPSKVYQDDVPLAILKRLSDRANDGSPIYKSSPLAIHNQMIRGMELASDLGEPLVTAEIQMEA